MATAIEYGLIAAGISVAIITVVQGLGTKLETTFSQASKQTTTWPVDWAEKCPAYDGLKITYPDVYAYLQERKPKLAQCNS